MDSAIEHLTQDSFDSASGQPGLMVIDFWARWCAPCRALAPQFERAAGLRPNYRFAKVDVDREPALAERFSIRSVPMLLVLHDGEPVAAQPGVIAARALVDALDRIAAAQSGAPALGAGAR